MKAVLLRAVTLMLIIGMGVVFKKVGWVSREDFPKFSKIVLRITLPAMIITVFNDVEIQYSLLSLTALGIFINSLMQLAGFLVNRKNGRQAAAFAILNVGSFNIGGFALPYISGFMGPEAVVYTSLYDVGNSISAGGIGYGWALSMAREDEKPSFLQFLRNMFKSPIFVTYLFVVLFRLLKLRLPQEVVSITGIIGGANLFVAMFMIGVGLEWKLSPEKLSAALRHLGVRYALALLLTILTLLFFPFSQQIKVVLCLLYFSPLALMVSGFTSEINGDVELSAFMTSVSILVSILAMPLIFSLTGSVQ